LSVEFINQLTIEPMSIYSIEAYRELRGAVSEALYRFAEGRIEEHEAARLITDISYQHWQRGRRTQKRLHQGKRF
jgi:hypothetical protein